MNSKKNEIYRRNARKNAIKTLTNKKRKLGSVVKSDNHFSDAETIQYTEPYRDTSKKDELYIRKTQKKAIKILTTSKKRKVREILSSDENFSDAETIQYADLYRDTSKKDEIYRRKAKKKAIKILTTNKKRKVNDEQQNNFSDAETIPYAEPYRNTSFTKKDEIYRKKAKRKAIKTLTRKKKTLPKKTKTIKLIEAKENDDLEITGFRSISHPRTRKRLKEKAVARANSAAVQSNSGIDLENLVDLPLLFNLRMTSEMKIEDWLVDNLAINNDEYYTEHNQGTNFFRIRKELDTESKNSEMVLNKSPLIWKTL